VTVEIPLAGGRITPGVVRVGDTVRRPQKPNSPFVHDLLLHLESVGFDAAPRFLGIDEQGREMLSYREGWVPDNIKSWFSDETLAAAARLLREYHDATAGWKAADVVCHNDISPVNFVFEDDVPVALIDFDMAAPGERLRDLSYGVFLWLALENGGRPLERQARRTHVFFDAYGIAVPPDLVDGIVALQRETAVRARPRPDAARWWSGNADWLDENRGEYERWL
jgi:tRNA A-37 threonylcarbamoyl transferase component Bud32